MRHVCCDESSQLYGIPVEEDAVVHDVADVAAVLARVIADGFVDALLHLAAVPGSGGNLVVAHVLPVGGSAVVGSEEYEVVVSAHLVVYRLQQSAQVAVELQVGIVGVAASRAVLMADDVGLRIAHAEHVGLVAFAQSLTMQGMDGHVGDDGATVGRQADVFAQFLELLVLCQLLVVVLRPLRQLVHVVGRGDEAAVLQVEPVGGVGAVACWQYGSAVLVADADDLRLEVGVQTQLVADGGGEHVAWRALALVAVAANGLHAVVFTAVNLLAADVEIVAADAVECRRGAGID